MKLLIKLLAESPFTGAFFIAEQKIRTQRILGKLIKEGQERKELASRSEHPGGNFSIKEHNTKKNIKTLAEVGLTQPILTPF